MPELSNQLLKLPNLQKLPKNLVQTITGKTVMLNRAELTGALDYIEGYWPQLTREVHQDVGTLIGLPHAYIVPSVGHENFQFEEQYYWDSYFTALGLVASGKTELALGMLENLLFLFERFGLVPNASRLYMTSRSQPPILTSYIRLMHEAKALNDERLQAMMAVAEKEYETVWMGSAHPHWRQVYHGLSRYYDINMLHDMAEAESGWDMTTRFNRCALDYVPVDLNSLLYKYEADFAWAAEQRGDAAAQERWLLACQQRSTVMNELMYSKAWGTYFDYNFARKKRGGVWSLAAYYPLWAGLATPEQAARLVANLAKFEERGGLVTTTKTLIDLSFFGSKSVPIQWAYPNGWAPLHYIVIEGLRRYGYFDDANRLATKWLATNLAGFKKYGVFIENYNVVNKNKHSNNGVYPIQEGFGWTNGVFVFLAKQLTQ